ncbi:MAG: aspartate kinase [Bacteroidota bacterium]
MEVFKFGGASVKDADSILNLHGILRKYADMPLVVVVSAMGKTTNLLESVWKSKNEAEVEKLISTFRDFHLEAAENLLEKEHEFFNWFNDLTENLKRKVIHNSHNDEDYSRIVSFGELASTRLIQASLHEQGQDLIWLDARDLIKTEQHFVGALVDWDKTIKTVISSIEKSGFQYITQGFISSNHDGHTTTLGREGSDFSGSILASALKAEKYTIWKDVPGVLSADPRIERVTTCYQKLTYQEAAEMTFYGVKAIHPKTIKPLANHDIPLCVRSFMELDNPGTLITRESTKPHAPAIIYRFNQALMTFLVADFTFVNEDHISGILNYLNDHRISVNLMQTSAVSISFCMDENSELLEEMRKDFVGIFKMSYNSGLKLVTIKNYDSKALNGVTKGFEILMEQKTRNNYRAVFRGALNEPA